MLGELRGTGGSPWAWRPDLLLWAALGAVVCAYVAAIHFCTGERVGALRFRISQPLSFGCAVAVSLAALGWPLADLAKHYLVTAHVLEHLLLALGTAPLLILGVPASVWRRPLGSRRVLVTARRLVRPQVAAIPFNVLAVVLHLPAVVDVQVRVAGLHEAGAVALLLAAVLMWWPVLGPLPELGSTGEPGKMLYLFLESAVLALAAAFLTFSSRPIYDTYASARRVFALEPVTDQMMAGVLVALVSGFVLWMAIAAQFLKGKSKDESDEAESISWIDFERDLEAWDLRKH